MAELHSITGTLYEKQRETLFGGYFTRQEGETKIKGQLIDMHGPSIIKGHITPKTLKFIKQYELPNQQGNTFTYSYKLKQGIWIGEYRQKPGLINGKTNCETHIIRTDLDLSKTGLTTKLQPPQIHLRGLDF
jgi:hypothetical protein